MASVTGRRGQGTGKSEGSSTGDGEFAGNRALAEARPEERGRMLKGMVETAINRVAGIVDEETAALRKGGEADFKAFNTRKSLGLVELTRVLRLMDGAPLDPATGRLLKSLGTKLEANQKILKLHMEAVGEVASIISRSIREADSDGTYSITFRSKEQAP